MASGQSPVPAGEFMNAAQKSSTFLILILLTVLFITGCRSGEVESTPTPLVEIEISDQFVGIPNPASFYCQEMGYELELRESAGGTEGICILPDGKECEEWEFLAGGCAIEWTFCQRQGSNIQAGELMGVCVFQDGSSCPEYDFFIDECQAP